MGFRLVAALVLICATATATVGQTSQSTEAWIGGYLSGKTFVPILVAVKVDAPRAYLILENSREVALTGWQIEGSRLAFSMPSGSATLTFRGTIANGVARGTVRRGDTESPFHLLNLHKLSDETLNRFAGSYAFDNRRHVVVRQLGVLLKYEDSETGRFGALAPIGESTFVGGPGQLMFDPMEVTANFVEDGLVLKSSDGSTIKGRKVNGHREEAIAFQNGGVTLSGTLFLPARPGPHPVLVGVHGSGAAARYCVRRDSGTTRARGDSVFRLRQAGDRQVHRKLAQRDVPDSRR